MSTETRARVEAALAEMRADYTRNLPAAVERIAGAVREARGDDDALQRATDEAHRIHGTAGSLQLWAISVAAGHVEEALEQVAHARTDTALWDLVGNALARLDAVAGR
ncbi:hypothetical protein A7982_12263 [Minicystis rosea]|nr:hypothetical protein A7982_12263 [Minicystis rosea]